MLPKIANQKPRLSSIFEPRETEVKIPLLTLSPKSSACDRARNRGDIQGYDFYTTPWIKVVILHCPNASRSDKQLAILHGPSYFYSTISDGLSTHRDHFEDIVQLAQGIFADHNYARTC